MTIKRKLPMASILAFIITKEQIDEMVDIIDETLTVIERKI